MLRFAEELLLLLLRDDGKFVSARGWPLSRALAGAVLMDLALEDRIDTDLDSLILVDPAPVGDDLLDSVLSQIAQGEQNDARYWVEQIAQRSDEIRGEALARLVENELLERCDVRFLWFFRARRYRVTDDKAVREVKSRVMDVLFSDEIPSPRDVAIISLMDACEIFGELLSRQELEKAAARIKQVQDLDLISQAMSQVIQDVAMCIAKAQGGYRHLI